MYYLALYNEPYPQPPKQEEIDEGILKGLYLFKKSEADHQVRAQILGSGPMMQYALRRPGTSRREP